MLAQPTSKPLSETAIKLAEESSLALEHLILKEDEQFPDAPLSITVELPDGNRADLSVPQATLPLLLSLLRQMGHGKGVAIVTTDTELTTQQAADILNVSRPYFVKLLTESKIPYRSVGSRRRVLVANVLRYKQDEIISRNRGLDELVAEAQKLGIY